MRTETLVRSSADVVRIVTLHEGDVYKRLSGPDYQGNYDAVYGIVQSVDNNGEDALISALEFTINYAGAEAKLKVFGTNSDLKLFAATPEEVQLHFTEVLDKASAAVNTARNTLQEKRAALALASRIIESVGQSLTAPATAGAIEPAVEVDDDLDTEQDSDADL